MARTPEDEQRDDILPAAGLIRALREDTVQDTLDDMQDATGLARERVIAEAVIFAGRNRAAFLAHLRGRPSFGIADQRAPSRARRFIAESGVEILVAGMFLLGAALAALQMLLG